MQPSSAETTTSRRRAKAGLMARVPAQVSFDALPDRRLTGKVMGVSPTSTVTQGVATYVVSVSIDSTDGSIPVGASPDRRR